MQQYSATGATSGKCVSSFNADKCKVMHISDNNPRYQMQGHEFSDLCIEASNRANILGLT